MKKILVACLVVLAGCSSLSIDESEIAEMRAYAYAHRTMEMADSRVVRFTAEADRECYGAGVPALPYIPAHPLRGCTVLAAVPYSILSFDASALDIAHEQAHREYGDWHKGAFYFTSYQWHRMGR